MARVGHRRGPSLPLLLLSLGLGFVLYLEVNAELPIPDEGVINTVPPGIALRLPNEPDFAMPPLETFSETLARPLFMATRRPPEPQPEPVEEEPERAPAKPKPVPVTLSGIVVSPTERQALLGSQRSKELIWVTEGQVIDGWTVRSILPDRVILHRRGVTAELELKDKGEIAPVKKRKKGTGRRPTKVEKRSRETEEDIEDDDDDDDDD